MGTENSFNPVHKDNGRLYKKATNDLYKLLQQNKQYTGVNNKANKAHDLLLAKIAMFHCLYLDNDMRLSDKNIPVKQFMSQAIDNDRFYRFFDHFIMQIRR